jgi:hypothetical protein
LFLAIFAIHPVVEMGVNDDFSYTQIALQAARTGKLLYNGWNTPMIGLQAYWGAAWIHTFGFSFDVVRASVLPFDAGCVLLLYLLFRSSGLSPTMTAFGVCTLTLSPLLLPLETSFMTDIPALFFLLLCLWAASRVVRARNLAIFLFWAVLLTTAGLAAGTIRQTVWIAPIVIFPLLSLQADGAMRKLAIGILWSGAVFGAIYFNSWFGAQPYSVTLPLFSVHDFAVRNAIWNLAALTLELLILLMPVLCFALGLKKRLPNKMWGWAVSCGIFSTAVLCIFHYGRPKSPQIPLAHLGGNLVTQWGLLGVSTEVIGYKPVIVPFPLQSLLVFLSVSGSLALLLTAAAYAAKVVRGSIRSPDFVTRQLSAFRTWSTQNVILAGVILYMLAYIPAAGTRALAGVAFDRYLVPLFPFMVLAILLFCERVYAPRLGWLPVCMLLLFSLFGIATAHDFFARSRARLHAAEEVIHSGVARSMVSAGLEYDGWTELDLSGHINDERIANPPHQFVSVAGRAFPVDPRYWAWDLTPSVHPKFLVVLSPQKELVDSRYPRIPYTTWLPPRRFEMLIQQARNQDH